MTKKQQQEKQEAIDRLREWMKPGDTVYTTLKHVSRSGMMRVIDMHIIRDNKPVWIAYLVSKAMGIRLDEKKDALRVRGCGMDMGFHLVHYLGYALYPNGYNCIGEDCPSNDHYNYRKSEVPAHHESGGYAFKHQWL